MRYAASSVRKAWSEQSVRPVPVPWPTLSRVIQPMGGQTAAVVAAPGVGKTTFALQWAAQARVPTLYASADTGPKILTANLASLATGHDSTKIKQRLAQGGDWVQTYADAIYRSFPHLITDFTSAPQLDVMAEKIEALCDVWGEPPSMVVIDTASDVARRGEGYESWEQGVWLPVRDMARWFNCLMVLCHHPKEGAASSGKVPLDMNAGQYKIHKFAEIVFGMYRSGHGQVTGQVLKNRGGRSDIPIPFNADLERARLTEA